MRDACTAGTIRAAKLSSPPAALMRYAAGEIATPSLAPPLRSEKAGVAPSRLMTVAASSGAAAIAKTAIVTPSST